MSSEQVDLPVDPPKKDRTLLVMLLVGAVAGVVVFGGIIAAIAIPNLLNAVDRGKQKRTMADLRQIAMAIESYAIDKNIYPLTEDFDELCGVLEPKYSEGSLPKIDGWGQSFAVQAYGQGYAIGSGGKDGEGALHVEGEGGPMIHFEAAIIMANGEFVQWPEGTQQ